MASAPVEPNEFAIWLAETMRTKRISRGDVAEAVDVDPTTVSRWITKNAQPQHEKIRPLAKLLKEPYPEVLARAGYGRQKPAENVEPIRRELDDLAVELGKMLQDSSPLTDEEREKLRIVIDAGMGPYRQKMHSKRRVG
jgi:transcriptional regulator with XRE-family HTH domain